MANDRMDVDGMSDARREEQLMYGHGAMTQQELDEKYPHRPHNHSKTLPFHDLFLTLFNPLNENKKRPAGPPVARKKIGPHGPIQAPNEVRRTIIQRFIGRWRKEVGDDIYPALRLIVPEKDRDRGMYGLKEATLGKLLVRIMKIDRNSEDGYNLIHWKLPGVRASSAMAGDFAGRCFEVLSKRSMRSTPGDMTIAEVNELLDRLSVAQKEENQRPILEEFYDRMNAEELMWLIRMILRQMKIGATEKTIFDLWHPDAENLFNISSNLRRVCWELYDPQVRLEGAEKGIALMQCFQPQLAAFQMRSMEQMVAKMNLTEEDPVFWIEEKLDGERMQLHMITDDNTPGLKKFGFWSRKAKDYTYLYGSGFDDPNGALTRHLKSAFDPGVRNIILDGEMITWDPKEDAIVPFGTLKTAALAERENAFHSGHRPLFRIFDCLYLNDKDLTQYTLRDRRAALHASVKSVHRRFEIHEYQEARQASEIEPVLRQVVAEASEGLVLKNPRSPYRLNERNDDWIKVKPEYMTEFGESLDCVVVGGYYGSGKRGGNLSSFMCGLRVPDALLSHGVNEQKCWSFFKVGGGFAASDYAEIRHRTEGKWIDWNLRKPPTDWVELAGGDRQLERPDVWIKPEDSIVLSVKAASVGATESFRAGVTLRFPRFKKLRTDKDWKQALTFDEFIQLKGKVEGEQEEKKLKIDDARRKVARKRKREVVIQGHPAEDLTTAYAGPATQVFAGMNFFIMTEAPKPIKKTKAELEALVKSNGGTVVASEKDPNTILIADRKLVKVASLIKSDERNILRPIWLLDCVQQTEADQKRHTPIAPLLLPYEPDRHLFHTIASDQGAFDDNIDEFGDSYARDLTNEQLLSLFQKMSTKPEQDFAEAASTPHEKQKSMHMSSNAIAKHLLEHDSGLDAPPGLMFHDALAYFDDRVPMRIKRVFIFAGGRIIQRLPIEGADEEANSPLTHVVIASAHDVSQKDGLRGIRQSLAGRKRLPRIVIQDWIVQSWSEKTRLDEETFQA